MALREVTKLQGGLVTLLSTALEGFVLWETAFCCVPLADIHLSSLALKLPAPKPGAQTILFLVNRLMFILVLSGFAPSDEDFLLGCYRVAPEVPEIVTNMLRTPRQALWPSCVLLGRTLKPFSVGPMLNYLLSSQQMHNIFS